ncbi:unnamed protein product [Rotaria sp. Silwood2]|nr:unnamed protein product [Rotaria sp. Silwood2]CAF2832250.1 unnamed protein product [Rotaria sp. Silwood2]CAF3270104.1 unnamed protein product [Rotaria sp. Silwood2]CAF4354933.1 unnamed protein product [Rotaria sp. Silwood2]CAF4361585.1 unnamed protein product [Rotaria sp. Silwood2]
MQLKLVSVSILFLYSSWYVIGLNAYTSSSSSSSGCGCCPLPKCDVKPFSCSSNIDCECLQMTVTGGGMCANVVISCSALTQCETDNKTCSVPNTICVNNTRCDVPVCYPIELATPQMCPPLTSGHISTSLSTTTTEKPTTTVEIHTTTTEKPTTTEIHTTTTESPRTTTITINACSNGTRCLNNGTCQPSGNSFFCLCPGSYYGSNCQNVGSSTSVSLVDEIINGSNITYERTVENVLNRNNWTNIVAVVDVTGSMLPCAAAVYKWMILAYERVNKIKYYVFFNDGDDKPQANKTIGSTGGLYGIDAFNMNTVLNTMKTAMKNGNGGDIPENDIEALLYGIKKCPNCLNIIHIADNQATPRDMILLKNVTKPVKVIVCQLSRNALNTNLMNIASNTGGSIHTLEQDILNLSHIPINGTITIGTRTYRRTITGYVLI